MSLQKLNKFIAKLEGIDDFIVTTSDNIIRRDRKLFVEQIRGQLTEAGVGYDGESLEFQQDRKSPLNVSGAYTVPYSRYKSGRGGTTAYVDLYLSGRFQKSIQMLQVGEGEWTFSSDGITYNYLLLNYGDVILGVKDEFLDEYTPNMEKELQEKVDKYLKV